MYGRNVKEEVIDFVPISDDSYIYQYDYDRFKRCHIKGNDVLIAIMGLLENQQYIRVVMLALPEFPDI